MGWFSKKKEEAVKRVEPETSLEQKLEGFVLVGEVRRMKMKLVVS